MSLEITNSILSKFQSRISDIDIGDIKEYEYNNKIHNQDQIELLAKNIDKFGFTMPLVLDDNNTIVVGHGRYMAAKLLGLKSVPAIKITDLSENEIKEYRLLDNKVTDLGEWDLGNLAVELAEIQNPELNDMFINFNLPEFVTETKDLEIEEDEDVDIDNTYSEVLGQEDVGEGSIKKIELYFNGEQFVELLDIFEKIMDEGKFDNITDLVIDRIETLYNNQK